MVRIICLAATAALLSGCSVIATGKGQGDTAPRVDAIAGQGAITGTTAAPTGSPAAEALSKMPFNCPSGGFTYTPVPAFPAFGYSDVQIDDAGKVTEKLKKWPEGNGDTNNLLTEISLELSKLNRNASAELGGFASADAANSSYLLDFMKYRLEPISDSSGAFLGWSKVGAGLRVIITFNTANAEAGASFAALSASVKAGQAKGYMSINLVGVNSSQVTAAMPFKFGELTDATMERVLEGMTILKTQLYETQTKVSPRTLARLECTGSVGTTRSAHQTQTRQTNASVDTQVVVPSEKPASAIVNVPAAPASGVSR